MTEDQGVVTDVLEEDSSALMAYVLTEGGALPSVEAISSYIGEEFPDCSAIQAGSSEEADENLLHFWIENRLVTVLRKGAPFPIEELEFFTSRAWWWPEAADAVGAHADHWIVSVMGADGDTLRDSLILTYVTAAVVHLTKPSAVIWSAGDRIASAEEFLEIALESRDADPALPLGLWVEIQVGWDESGQQSALYTTGMESLGYPDVEVQGSTLEPVELVERILGLLLYVVDQEVTFEEGDTFGDSEENQTRVHYGPSLFEVDREVLVVEFP